LETLQTKQIKVRKQMGFEEALEIAFRTSGVSTKSLLYKDIVAVYRLHCKKLAELLKNAQTTLNDKKFSFSIGHVGLAEGRMQVIDVGFVKKILEELEGLLKK